MHKYVKQFIEDLEGKIALSKLKIKYAKKDIDDTEDEQQKAQKKVSINQEEDALESNEKFVSWLKKQK